jgi:uncharacterized protein YhbP (UPF0306 family)
MQEIDKKVLDFIKEHHVLTLATCSNNVPWCCQCFYVFLKDELKFVFTSNDQTRHILEALKQPVVAASIVLETKIVGKIQGVQITGRLDATGGELLNKYKMSYLKRFPIAATMDTKYWTLTIDYMKMTDNRLVFGQKLIWERNA